MNKTLGKNNIYKLIPINFTEGFRENLTFAEISERLDNMENIRIVEKLDQIALAMRISCGI